MSEGVSHLSLRDRVGRIEAIILDWLYPPDTVSQAHTFDEFRALSRSKGANYVSAFICADEKEPGKFRLSAKASSWRDDQGSKSAVVQEYREVLRGDPDESLEIGGVGLMTRLALTVINGIEGLPGVKIYSIVNRIGRPSEIVVLDEGLRHRIKDIARDNGLVPLIPVLESPKSQPSGNHSRSNPQTATVS
ncbi:MAG: hypothetical protein HY426_04225 [Candidatus Levybacteria bacterium]|nr:hypothetical protein [Candidatus Levybacteria bacterium]